MGSHLAGYNRFLKACCGYVLRATVVWENGERRTQTELLKNRDNEETRLRSATIGRR